MTVFSSGYCLGAARPRAPVGLGHRRRRPAVIPLGTGCSFPATATGVAADTGGAVRGATIDVWFPECSQARAWGRKYAHDHASLTALARSTIAGSTEAAGGQRRQSPTIRAPGKQLDELRVLLVDDHDLFRTRPAEPSRGPGPPGGGEADNGRDALRLVGELAPDVVVMDLKMPELTGVETTRQVSSIAPRTRVVVLTISADDDDVMDAVVAGACGYLLKDSSIDQLIAGIRAAASGESLISPQIAARGPPAPAVSDRRHAPPRARSAPSSRTASSTSCG